METETQMVDRIENEINAVFRIMSKHYGVAVEYNVIDDDYIEVFNSDTDKVIDVINSDKLTDFWNEMEGFFKIKF